MRRHRRSALAWGLLALAGGCGSSGVPDASAFDAPVDTTPADVDGAAPDAGVTDVPVVSDLPAPTDVPTAMDTPVAMDVVVAVDATTDVAPDGVLATDVPSAMDLPSVVDVAPDVTDVMDVPLDPTIYVAPTGSGAACTQTAPCDLPTAVTVARTRNLALTADLNVVLANGTYGLAAPLVFTAADSGSNGHAVVYQAAAGATPVVSGGVSVHGPWTLSDAASNVWQATVDGSITTRQMYVNGVRAVRARTLALPAGFTKTATGFTAPDATMAAWGNPSDIEFVGYTQWKSYRCDVASIVGANVTLAQPCWANSQSQPGVTFDAPEWIENARELLDAEGEYYLDRSTHVLSYKPRAGEDITTANVVLPVLETVVEGAGTPDAPVHDITFRGLTFAYATWLRPGTADGYARTSRSGPPTTRPSRPTT